MAKSTQPKVQKPKSLNTHPKSAKPKTQPKPASSVNKPSTSNSQPSYHKPKSSLAQKHGSSKHTQPEIHHHKQKGKSTQPKSGHS